MRYVLSDPHGNLALLKALLSKIGFGKNDTLIVLGDLIDKGRESVALMKFLSGMNNVKCIIGNHELAFLNYYRAIMMDSPTDFDEVLSRLREYFEDGDLLDYDLIDWLESLPAYIETDSEIFVHAGIPILKNGELMPLVEASTEELVHDRRFKEPSTCFKCDKCVFFGHTETRDSRIVAYLREGVREPQSVADISRVHLDTGVFSSGIMGAFCIDTCRVVYVESEKYAE